MGTKNNMGSGMAKTREVACMGCMYELIHRCNGCGIPICRFVGPAEGAPLAERGFGGNGCCQMLPHYAHNGKGYCVDCHERARQFGGEG